MSIPILFSGNRASAWTPRNLFASGEQGAWYDPSDFSTLFQDAAGTTAVTAVEQPVGLMRDKSGRGNHATASADANRPTLSARVNSLTKTEIFSDNVWGRVQTSISSDVATAPDGTGTADKLVETNSSNIHFLYRQNNALTANVNYTFSLYVKAGERSGVQLWVGDGSPRFQANFDLASETVTGTVVDLGTVTATSITKIGATGWYRVSVTGYVPTSQDYTLIVMLMNGTSHTYQGDGTSGIYIWGADLRVANESLTAPAYQRVNTSTDYDTVGFPVYLSFNGTSSALATGSIDLTGTSKLAVITGFTKSVDRAAGQNGLMLAEFGSAYNTAGSFFIYSVQDATNGKVIETPAYQGGQAIRQIPIASAPTTAVLSVVYDLGASGEGLIKSRINGIEGGTLTNSAASGSFGNNVLNIGARAGTSLWLNGRIYSLIVRGAATSTADIVNTETWVNRKTGAY